MPRKIFLPTQKADAAAHTSPKVSAPAAVFWSQPDACEVFRWTLIKTVMLGVGAAQRGYFRGTLLQRVYMGLLLGCFHWRDPGGRRWGWIPWFTPTCDSKLFGLWPSLAKQKTWWPTEPADSHFWVRKNLVIKDKGEEKNHRHGHAVNPQDKTISRNSEE